MDIKKQKTTKFSIQGRLQLIGGSKKPDAKMKKAVELESIESSEGTYDHHHDEPSSHSHSLSGEIINHN